MKKVPVLDQHGLAKAKPERVEFGMKWAPSSFRIASPEKVIEDSAIDGVKRRFAPGAQLAGRVNEPLHVARSSSCHSHSNPLEPSGLAHN